jgi:ribose transport system ATP-binding protein/inositol transport system ATP-binding protein
MGGHVLNEILNHNVHDNILEVRNLSKAFGGTQALNRVQLKVKYGEVHALVGENGAGKSTLMKVIIGLFKSDAGEIFFDGEPLKVNGPAEAIERGISMIHQELNPEPYLTVAENIFLKREHTKGIFLNKKETNIESAKILKQFNFNVNPQKMVDELTLAQIQMLEIIKAVSCNAKLVIMDEPTSSLDNEESERLFQTIRELKKQGVSIIYISHRMEEIFHVCDRVSVFRDGQYVGTDEMKAITSQKLISMMVGREISNIFPKKDCEQGEVVFSVAGLTGNGFKDICFEVRRGEILGITGLAGGGRSETMRAIFGLDVLYSGKIYLEGKEVKIKSPKSAIKLGIAMVNEDRRSYGLCLFRSIIENISLPNLPGRQKGPFLNKRREKKDCTEFAQKLMVKAASLKADANSLSGGNQQKVVLAKWIMATPKVLILDEPTRGVDVGAKSEIHALMSKFVADGMAIIMISSELPEIMGMSDRVIIYHEGRINGEVTRKDILNGTVTQETILAKEFGGV